jgi:rubrerythrin
MTTGTAVDQLKERAQRARNRGMCGLADLIEQNAAQGEEHAAQYLDMMRMVGESARRIRQAEGW